MDYKDYTVEDFVLNKRFRKWILNPQKEDNLFWQDYIRKHPYQLTVIEQAKKIVIDLPKIEHQLDKKEKDLLWATIEKKIEEADHKSTKVDKIVIPMHSDSIIKRAAYFRENKMKYDGVRKLLVAASVLIFLSLSFWIVNSTILTPEEQEVRMEKIIRHNTWGQKSTVYMSDGTEVILNSGSTLSYYQDFESDKREVELDGEAFFKVAKDSARPFRVITNNIITQALGTSFNVNSFSSDKISISLVTGSVKVIHSDRNDSLGKEMILAPGEQLDFISSVNEFNKKTFDTKEICSWKDGIIYFHDADSKEVFTYLEKWYGVKIRELNKPLKKWNYTGEFNNLDLQNVLTSIGFSMNFEFARQEETYTIHYLN